MLRRSVPYLCYAYYYDWQANSRRKSFCLSSFHDPLPAKRCETTAIITIVPCHALCQQSSPLCHWTVIHPSSGFLVLPTIIASAIHSFIRAPLPGSIISSSVPPPFSQLDALFVLDALLARRLLWWPFVATPVFTHLHLHLHFASIISMPRLMLRALWHQRQQQ